MVVRYRQQQEKSKKSRWHSITRHFTSIQRGSPFVCGVTAAASQQAGEMKLKPPPPHQSGKSIEWAPTEVHQETAAGCQLLVLNGRERCLGKSSFYCLVFFDFFPHINLKKSCCEIKKVHMHESLIYSINFAE